MKYWIAVLFTLLLLTGCAKDPEPTFRQVTAPEAISIMESETGYLILDVRTQAEFEQGHIPGAVCIPNETIGADPIPALDSKEQLILVYCRSGNRSKQAAQKLAQQGYTNVVEFGGIMSWPGEIITGNEETN